MGDENIAQHSSRFFKTEKGQYGEGDLFLGIRVPELRRLAKDYKDVSLGVIKSCLYSKYHETRLLALILLVQKFQSEGRRSEEKIYSFYMSHLEKVNNWDLVDTSAPTIVGAYLMDRPKKILYDLAGSENLWERRIAIMATLQFIRNHHFSDTLNISRILLNDAEDLIHKAVGWMLREVGNRDRQTEINFLDQVYKDMPRVMLRYAIEKFPNEHRSLYLKGLI